MSMNWTAFLGGFQQGTQIGNQLGSQYELRQLQNQEVSEIPGQPNPAPGTGIVAQNSGQPAQPFAGEVKPAFDNGVARGFPVSPDGPAVDNFGVSGAQMPPAQNLPMPIDPNAPPPQAQNLPNPNVVPQDPAAVTQNLGQPAQPPQGAQDEMSAMRYSFLGQEYDEKPTDLQIRKARADARANIYEEFNQPAMAAQARNFGDQLGIKNMQKKILDYQTKELERKENTELQVLQFKQEAMDAYAMKEGAFGNLVNDFGGATTADGVMAVDVGKDGKYTITAYGQDGNPKGNPKVFDNEASIPPALRNQLISGMMSEKYGRLGPEFQTDYFQQLQIKEGLQAGRQNAALNEQKFNEGVRQFDARFQQDEEQIEQAQKNWTASMGMEIFRFNDAHRKMLLDEKATTQMMNERALKIKTMKNPPPKMWHKQLEILDKPWDASAPEIAWAMGLDIVDEDTLSAINVWKSTTQADAQAKALQAGGGTQPGALNQ